MNSYFLGLSGSWFLVILFFILAFGLALYAYRITNPTISSKRKNLLITLRTFALIFLIFVLFEPILSIITGKEEKPRLGVLLDNSLSVAHSDAKGDRKQDYKKAFDNLNLKSLDDESLTTIQFDNNTKELKKPSFDSLKFNGQLTDISKALKWVINNSEAQNIRASLIITDGVFNTGTNPIYDADVFGKPLYIVGIGDTSEQKDVSIQSIITNNIAYIENPLPINVNVSITGYTKGELKLKLLDNGNQISEQTITVNPENKSYSAIFEYKPVLEGIHKITAQISNLENEITTKNNILSEFINVLKNKRKIAIFAGAPSPDVSFIRNTLTEEKGVDIKLFVQKEGSEFYDKAPSKQDLQDVDIVFLIGFPINSSPQNSIDLVKNLLDAGKPFFFIASQFTDYTKLQILENYLPFTTLSSRTQEFSALPDFKKSALANPLVRISGSDNDLDVWNKLPPIFKTETFVKVKPESEVISGVKVNNIALNEPLILSRNFQSFKSIAVLGYGLYRWKLLGYAADIAKGRTDIPDLFDIFINNSTKWLTTDQSKKNVVIKTTKKIFLQGEKVEFVGQVYDAALTPVDNAMLNIKVSGGNEPREIILNSIGNGRYTGSLENLPEGDYYFSGIASLNGNKLGTDNGRFNIGDLAVEYQNLRMNVQLLKELANRTGGKFYFVNEATNFLNDLKNNKLFITRPITKKAEYALWSLPWLLGLSIMFFAIEWFLRKRYGML